MLTCVGNVIPNEWTAVGGGTRNILGFSTVYLWQVPGPVEARQDMKWFQKAVGGEGGGL